MIPIGGDDQAVPGDRRARSGSAPTASRSTKWCRRSQRLQPRTPRPASTPRAARST
ncbi:MAG: hypothetical protein MZW92_39115 [Comamonadaceae bacterium]|nr:hypothetical protein [Comamonadaceae bacterium]